MSLFRRNKNNNKPVIRQVIDLVPPHLLRSSVKKYQSDKYCHKYKTYDQLVALLFGQLCKCSTLEDISVCIGVSETFINPDFAVGKNTTNCLIFDYGTPLYR
jgi:hypothetical protein